MNITNECNMELMGRYPDNFFDLAIVDPEYGIGEDGKKNHSRSKIAKAKQYAPKKWDQKPSETKYFIELKRVSKNQIIWGANHFTQYLPSSMGWIFWDKGQDLSMSDGELAFTSFKTNASDSC